MRTFETIQCASCGAPYASSQPQKPMLECEHCGSMINDQVECPAAYNKTKPVKLTLMLVMLPVVVVTLMIVFWVVFQNIREQTVVSTSQASEVVTYEVGLASNQPDDFQTNNIS